MNEGTMAFLIWAAVAAVFAALGVYCLFAKKAVGFWANAEVFEVTDTRRYNAAVAKLFFAFGVGTLLLGLPLLAEESSAWVLVPILGMVAECIAAMVVYTAVIEKKYRKK